MNAHIAPRKGTEFRAAIDAIMALTGRAYLAVVEDIKEARDGGIPVTIVGTTVFRTSVTVDVLPEHITYTY